MQEIILGETTVRKSGNSGKAGRATRTQFRFELQQGERRNKGWVEASETAQQFSVQSLEGH